MIAKEIQFPKFPPDIYVRIALNDLVTYAVYFLSQHGGEINAEDIVAACFKLFPERFRLRGYSEWPDSTVVNKRWLDCRDKGLLHGSTAGGFSLTPDVVWQLRMMHQHISEKRASAQPSQLRINTSCRSEMERFWK